MGDKSQEESRGEETEETREGELDETRHSKTAKTGKRVADRQGWTPGAGLEKAVEVCEGVSIIPAKIKRRLKTRKPEIGEGNWESRKATSVLRRPR